MTQAPKQLDFGQRVWPPQQIPPLPPSETLPTMYDLPSEDPEEPGLPDEFHDYQPQLLSRTLHLTHYGTNFFTGTDINLYYDVQQPLWYKRPDWFLAVGVPRLYKGEDLRLSYVVWQEGVNPLVAIELLSPGTEKEDLGPFASGITREDFRVKTNSPPSKWVVYEQILRVPYYIVFSRYTRELRFFKLTGACYAEQAINETLPQIWIAEIDRGLGIWEGEFADIPYYWLRWCDAQGNWLLTDTEQAQQERQQADLILQRTVRNLNATGMTLEQISQILELPVEQVERLFK